MNRRTLRTSLFLFLSLTVPGCGGDDGPEMAPVSGVVTLKDAALPRGTITFLPEGDGQPASGTIGPDGSYTLQTVKPGDGARLGKYKVIVITSDVDTEKFDTALRPSQIPRAKRITSPKYESPETTPLTAEVVSGPNRLDFRVD